MPADTTPQPVRAYWRCLFIGLTALVVAVAVLALAGRPAPAFAHDPHVKLVRQFRQVGHRVVETTHGDALAGLASAVAAYKRARAVVAFTVPPDQSGQDLANQACGPELSLDDTANAVDLLRPKYKVVYAYPADQPDQYGRYANVIAQIVSGMEGIVSNTSGDTLGLRVDEGTACGPQYLDIQSVRLPRTLAQYQAAGTDVFALLSQDVAAEVSSPPGQRTNVLMFADYIGGNGFPYAGQGDLMQDDSPGFQNASNDGGELAVVYGNGGGAFINDDLAAATQVTTHEVFHTLGAVQNSAPYATGAGHCWVEQDIMCYADGGPTAQPLVYQCGQQALDCGNQDYWSVNPGLGSYLANHWDTRNSVFVCSIGESCNTPVTLPTAVITGPGQLPSGQTASFTGARSSGGDASIVEYDWSAGPGLSINSTGPAASVSAYDTGTTWVQLQVTNAEGVSAQQRITVDLTNVSTGNGAGAGSESGGGGGAGGGGSSGTRRPPARLQIVTVRIRGHRLSLTIAAPHGASLRCALSAAYGRRYMRPRFYRCWSSTFYTGVRSGRYRLDVTGGGGHIVRYLNDP